ncbi:PAAR domain-containing protein [Paraburkholderia lacunae]|uniref:PAAR domain-containing protein n=1 Tax=Paraburkholderia lacunae TaxID=2211104 RepID=UPI001FCBA336|nr:PAAR domain-containing protein [Paraburkholderia lacunae]
MGLQVISLRRRQAYNRCELAWLIPDRYTHSIGEYFQSDLGRATALDQHVNRPNNVVKDAGRGLKVFFHAHPSVQADPSTWGQSRPAYEGDSTSHGGKILGGSDGIRIKGRRAARIGDIHAALIVGLACVATNALAKDVMQLVANASDSAQEKTLCTAGEDVHFSCELDGVHKIASVCAAKNVSPDDGYVQYRYGTQSKLDFKYPSTLVSPRNTMSIIDVSRTAQGLGAHLKFKNGNYHYVVSNAFIPGEVYVAKNGKIIFDKICKGTDYIPFSEKAKNEVPWGALEKIDGLDNH